jgi:hypothetical protein
MLARNESEQRRCGAHPSVIRGYACSMDEAGLYFPFRRRLGLRTRPKRLPANRSVQSELGARLGDRALVYLGDSVSNEMKTLLLDRNEDLKRLAPGGGFLNFRRTDADALFGQVAYAAEADRDLGAYERKMVEFLDGSYRGQRLTRFLGASVFTVAGGAAAPVMDVSRAAIASEHAGTAGQLQLNKLQGFTPVC